MVKYMTTKEFKDSTGQTKNAFYNSFVAMYFLGILHWLYIRKVLPPGLLHGKSNALTLRLLDLCTNFSATVHYVHSLDVQTP